ncbi:DUF3153 domain-containing protein [Polycladomyces subterraneus]|uniref:DUF3153 domain-containing protein n=1 Tax=Polycladomyces subterraneus TaxID=1016997 RepID=A0ABT8ILW0_9BACL|nr:DUF3153 domain-containing protein [Polycladomyces subterraneus]MDN4593767.1 DUF3153 domain-containing protein [Polycladomyces subterraneus]
MKPKRSRYGWVLLTMVCVMLLTGCVNATMHITVHSDGSGVYQLKLLSNPLLAEQIAPIKDRLQQKGYQVKTVNEGDQTGWVAEKHVDNVLKEPPDQNMFKDLLPNQPSASLAAVSTDAVPQSGSSGQPAFHFDPGFFTLKFRVDTHVDLRSMKDLGGTFLGDSLGDLLHLRLMLTLPIAPDHHNANNVTDDGKILTWDLKPGQDNPIFMEAEFPNPLGWGAILLIVVILLIVRRVRKKRQHPPTVSNGSNIS